MPLSVAFVPVTPPAESVVTVGAADPVAGDTTYGGPAGVALQLHARAVSIPLYPAKPAIQVTAPPPPHMIAALTALGYKSEAT